MNANLLPVRAGPRPAVHQGMPHAQIDIIPDAAILAELFRRAYNLPDVENRPTVISVPGARALWLKEGLPLMHPELIVAGREFAHIHPDGSLHVTLALDRAEQAIAAGWAERHPIAEHIGIPGLVLLYTPRTSDELDVILQLIVDAYNLVTGRSLQLEDLDRADAAE